MEAIQFKSPCKIGIYGPSMVGKSYWTSELLKKADIFFTEAPEQILYCYEEMQPLFMEMEATMNNITFKKGLPSEEDLAVLTSSKKHTILVLDDLMFQSQSDPFIE